nr:hypothetical protein [Acidobacterium capsulatum]
MLLGLFQFLLNGSALGDIANNGQRERLAFGRQGTEHDVDRKFGSIAAKSKKFEIRPHRTGMRSRLIALQVCGVIFAKSSRDQDFDRLTNEFVPLVAKGTLRRLIGSGNPATRIHDEDSVGRTLKDGAQQFRTFCGVISRGNLQVNFHTTKSLQQVTRNSKGKQKASPSSSGI